MGITRRELFGRLAGTAVAPVVALTVVGATSPIPTTEAEWADHALQVRVLDSSKPWVLVAASYNIATDTVTRRYRNPRTGEAVLHTRRRLEDNPSQ